MAGYLYSQQGKSVPIYYVPEQLTNAHMLLCGMSGTGKSTQSVRLLNSIHEPNLDIFDVHGELHVIRDAVSCTYSQRTMYGYNPLVLDTNRDSGGVDRQVNFIVRLIKDVTPGFGVRQEAVLRNLLTDVYALNYIYQAKPDTWARAEMTEAMREEMIASRRYQDLKKYYPTLEDVKSYAKRKIVQLTIGGDNKSITAFDRLKKDKAKLHQLIGKFNKSAYDAEIAKLESTIAEQKNQCVEMYSTFITEMKTGRELDDILKYDSVEVLSSVVSRLDLLMSAGILRSNPPPFNGARVKVHQIVSIDDYQQVMFVKLRLQEIFWKYKRVGPTKSGVEIRHIIFLDEAHKFFSDDSTDIINIIAKEGRKFGIGLWCAAQEPTAFPESFLTNCGATILLGVHSAYWKRTSSMLRITEDQLKQVKAKEVLAIKMQRSGAADPPFVHVIVPNPSNKAGMDAGGFN